MKFVYVIGRLINSKTFVNKIKKEAEASFKVTLLNKPDSVLIYHLSTQPTLRFRKLSEERATLN